MAYGCAGSSPAFRTILKGGNNAKLLFPFAFSDLENLIGHLIVWYFALCFYFAVTGIARLEVTMVMSLILYFSGFL